MARVQKQVEPPRPLTLLSSISFIVVAGSVFVILPVVSGILALVVAAVELMLAENNVSGDFSNIVIGDFLWRFAGLPFRHWIAASVLVVAGTALFVLFTKAINKK